MSEDLKAYAILGKKPDGLSPEEETQYNNARQSVKDIPNGGIAMRVPDMITFSPEEIEAMKKEQARRKQAQ